MVGDHVGIPGVVLLHNSISFAAFPCSPIPFSYCLKNGTFLSFHIPIFHHSNPFWCYLLLISLSLEWNFLSFHILVSPHSYVTSILRWHFFSFVFEWALIVMITLLGDSRAIWYESWCLASDKMRINQEVIEVTTFLFQLGSEILVIYVFIWYRIIKNDHTTVTAPLPVCSAKLSTVGPG